PHGRWLGLSDYGGVIRLMDSRTGEAHTLGRHKVEAATTAFDPEGRYLITGGWERELICWDVSTRQRAFTIDADGFIAQVRADGLACALVTGTGVRLHTFERPDAHRDLAEDLGPRLHHAAFSPDGRWLAASADEHLGVWNLAGRGPGALVEEAAGAYPFWTASGDELFGSSTRSRDYFRWRVRPATNDAMPPVMERQEVPKPSGFTSLSLASNRLSWTGSRGSRITELQHGSLDDDQWVRTARGINGTSADGRWLAIYGPYSPFLYVYRLP